RENESCCVSCLVATAQRRPPGSQRVTTSSLSPPPNRLAPPFPSPNSLQSASALSAESPAYIYRCRNPNLLPLMRDNAVACLKRQVFAVIARRAFHNAHSKRTVPCRRQAVSSLFSTRLSSVHGEKPSAEYAKLRKESLESEFGNALTSRSKRLSMYFSFGPFLALYRAAYISYEVFKLTLGHFFVHDIKKRSEKFCDTLIRLGPFYIKLGQALSTRPDILPSVYCNELAKLQLLTSTVNQDQIPPFPTKVAIRSIESQLGVPISQIFSDISPEPVAAASLGQVYKGTCLKKLITFLRDKMLSDLLLSMVSAPFCNGVLYRNFWRLTRVMMITIAAQQEKTYPKENCVKVPKIYWNFTRRAVLTMEWIDGIKLNDEAALKKASLNRKELIDRGLYCSLMQLLEVGFFHADPHPGNLVATKEGALAYFDFGMMGDIPRHYRVGLIQVLVHFVNRDSLGLANDFLMLGFIPEGVDMLAVSDALKASFGDGTRQSQDFQFNFSLPPDYALVIRALGSLEGTAKTLDPEFKVVESAYPFVIGRLLADPSPDMRKILRELLIRNDGSIRWNRLERLVDGEVDDTHKSSSNPLEWKSFDMHAVVSATEDLFKFILSEKGFRVRLFIVRDIVKVADIFLQDEVTSSMFDENQPRQTVESEGEATLKRVVNGFGYFWQAVKLAPDVWAAMLIRMALNPEVHRFYYDIISALFMHSSRRVPDTFWISVSRLLHKLVKLRNSSY
ncbi:Protein kinase-like domain-containing protein, partial [Cynara cardunculus var. scolymus]